MRIIAAFVGFFREFREGYKGGMSRYLPIATTFSKEYIENRQNAFPGPDWVIREKFGLGESDLDLLSEEDSKELYFKFQGYCDEHLRPSAHWVSGEYANICFLLLRYVVSENRSEVQQIKAQSAGNQNQTYSMRLLDFLRPHTESINLAMMLAYPKAVKSFQAEGSRKTSGG